VIESKATHCSEYAKNRQVNQPLLVSESEAAMIRYRLNPIQVHRPHLILDVVLVNPASRKKNSQSWIEWEEEGDDVMEGWAATTPPSDAGGKERAGNPELLRIDVQ